MSKEIYIERVFERFFSIKNGTNEDLQKIIREELKKFKGVFHKMPTKNELLSVYLNLVKENKLKYDSYFEDLLTTKIVRSSSGVLPISIALSAIPPQEDLNDGNVFSCAFNCSFCPNECISNGAPKDIARSYLSNEGTFIRGALSDFDTIRQVWRRLAELESMGHLPDKLEIIPLGGTWGCYSKDYRHKFSNELFYACNTYRFLSIQLEGEYNYLLNEWLSKKPFLRNLPIPIEIYKKITTIFPIKSLKEEKDLNTKLTSCRIIGIVFETRPDKINRVTLTEKRILGCTRIQLGIQHTDNTILKLNNRGHSVETSIRAIKYCRDAGFKVDIHIMPDLPFTTLEKDYQMIRDIFLEDNLQPDYCKLYPCLDLPYTQARIWKENGMWKPIAENSFKDFLDFLCYTLSVVPPWVRVNRVQRDFLEGTEKNKYLGFVSETIKTNLHQIVEQEMKKRNMMCFDIRSREIKNIILSKDFLDNVKLYIRTYKANNGTEFFISIEIPKNIELFDDTYLLGLCRLRFPDWELNKTDKIPNHYLNTFRNKNDKISRIRELHVYGNTRSRNSQHKGIGTFLIQVAEEISSSYGFNKCAIISGVGVRNYYERLGYYLNGEDDEYMVKNISNINSKKKLELFGKLYDTNKIIKNIKNNNNDYTYKNIQNGYAKGYILTGTNKFSMKKLYILIFIILSFYFLIVL